ncbi:inositol monophosphatase family protein [Ensifer sp. 4252]|uniref:inositol monophosphatase family protein n=1 Tax=Ensifer sp. 4252 TaxID=3373915 RepID=UPI003D1F87E1
MDSNSLESRAIFLRSLIRAAGEIVMQGFGASRQIEIKGPQDYLTETDALCETFIRQQLAAEYPEDAFFGEETGGQSGDNIWVVDPIDGTANFARNIPHFCVSIAFVSQGRTEIGAIYNPALNEMYFARRGSGATLNDRPIQTAQTPAPQVASIEFGWSARVPNASYMTILDALLYTGFNARRAGSGALGLAYVADGRSDGYAEIHMNSWDCLAGLLLVEEAGGRVCPFLDLGTLEAGGPVLASAPRISAVLSNVTGIVLAEREDVIQGEGRIEMGQAI